MNTPALALHAQRPVKLADPPSQSRVPQTPTPRVTADEGEGPEAQKNPHAH
jgi:hypothetical protein